MKYLLLQANSYQFRIENRHYQPYETIDYLGEKCKSFLNCIKFLE